MSRSWEPLTHHETSRFGSKRLTVEHNGGDEIFITAADGQQLCISFDSRRFFQITGKNGLTFAPGKVGECGGLHVKTVHLHNVMLPD